MKINYRIRKAKKRIKEILDYDTEELANLATDYLGKEFNPARGYVLKGRRKALKEVIEVFNKNNLYSWS